MPFIKPEERDLFEDQIRVLSSTITTPGELNYVITKLIHNCLLYDYLSSKGLNYTTINEVIGVLECAKATLIETVLIPYEKSKQLKNGPISKLDDDSNERMR